MFRSPLGGRRRLPATLLLAAVLAPAALPAGASAASRIPAQTAYQRADHATIAAAKRLGRCQGAATTVPVRCRALDHRLQVAGRRLSAAQKRLGRVAAAAAVTGSASPLSAPVLTAAGVKLSWTKVGTVTSYLLVTKQPGKPDVYSIVNGTSTTPVAVPGATLTFNVRTAVAGSKWASEVKIAYPADLTAARKAAPVIAVSGTTLSWSRVADVTRYEFVTKVAGEGDTYQVIDGTSVTPAARPGKTVTYGLRTLVDGSAWAREVSISYGATATAPATGTTTPAPTATAPAPASAPAPVPSGSAGTPAGFQTGVVAGSAIDWQLGFISLLGAKHARMEFDVNTSLDTMKPIILHYAQAGVQPLLLATFNGRTPTSADAQKMSTWAATFGPGGSFWADKGLPVSVQPDTIEWGNETNNPYQYNEASGNWPYASTFLARAKAYAQSTKAADLAIKAANPKVKILAVGDEYAGYTTWVDAMFEAVPNLGDYVDGWTVHPYGPEWKTPIDTMISATRSHGAADIPIYATEYGISTDNGRCLSDNFGWGKCLTYDQAATTLDGAIAGMQARYGSRLRAVYLYSTSDLAATGASTDREMYFGALQNTKATKGAYTAEYKKLLAASV